MIAAIVKLLKDLLYGGRNEYLDIVRLLGLLAGLVFLVLEVLKAVRVVAFDDSAFATSFGILIGAIVAAIYGRNHSDKVQQDRLLGLPRDPAGEA